jgi:tetratricopeptide (TPR) repeat protein
VLVEQRDEGERYRMLDTIREYAREKLREAGEENLLRDRHLEFLLTLAEEAEQHLFDAEETTWLDRLETERDNLRSAVEWSLEGERAASGLRLMAALWYFWFSHGPLSEARARLEQGLERPAAVERTKVRANALNALGILNWGEVNQSDLGPRLEEALAIGTELGDKAIVATSLRHLGLSAHLAGNFEQARTLLQQSLMVGRELGPLERHRNSQTLLFLGDVILNQGDSDQAKILYQESMVVLGETQNKNLLAYAIRRVGQLASDQGDSQRGAELCKESLNLNMEVGDRRGVIACVAALAGIALEQGHLLPAARLCGAVQVLLTAAGLRLMQVDEVRYEHSLAALRARLDEVSFEMASTAGKTMTREQAIDYALEDAENG